MKKVSQLSGLLWFAIILLMPVDVYAHIDACKQLSLPSNLEKAPFRHKSSAWKSKTTAYHSAQDILITPGEDVVIEGKFSYGSISIDLEDEVIELWLDNCSGALVRIGEVITDNDGRSKVIVKSTNFPETGIFQIYHRVMGDGTFTTSMLRILPERTKLVVFDVDGTLTVGDSELWNNILDGSYVPMSRKGGPSLTQFWYYTGHEIVYLSGRHYLLTDRSRQWLEAAAYAEGTLVLAQSVGDIIPSKGGAGEYKRKYLQRLQASGFVIVAAYGNSTTDIYAYEESAIPKSAMFMLGENGGVRKTIALGDDFLAHLNDLFEQSSD